MAIGPVQLIVLGFNHPNFHGEVIQELERLRDSDTIRVIDALAVHKTPTAKRKAWRRAPRPGPWPPPTAGFISPLDLVGIGLLAAEEAEELHAMETAATSTSVSA
jgi:hypothetical protein